MAQIFPTLENIRRLKVQPTEGEWFLINYLIENLSNDIEIYFQPFLNGDMPDIIVMQKDVGVTIIEVKDWNLQLYSIDENNKWHLKENNALLKSPFQQVFTYKENMFNLHIDGLLQAKLKNKNFYQRIKVFVYFHKASKKDLENFYNIILSHYKTLESQTHNDYKDKKFRSFEIYEKKLDYLKQKKSKIERDLKLSVGNDNLRKISLPEEKVLFSDEIYKEFKRYLQPPQHTLNQGIEIQYTKDQKKLITSEAKHQKARGVAGSGKTLTLAKRAVNAHKRHGERVLILTFNIALQSYIHDKISDVREDFNWGVFCITNYHQYIKQLLNHLNIEIEVPDNVEVNTLEYIDKEYFSNLKLFEEHKDKILKYQTIIIDEVQDYKSEWIEIIKKYILEKNSEFVLFGDEKQNIYERVLDKDQRPNTKIVGAWSIINEPIRYIQWNGSQMLSLIESFQEEFLKEKYHIDKLQTKEPKQGKFTQETLIADKAQILFEFCHYEKNQFDKIAFSIINQLREYDIHNDDAVIVASNISMLRELDYIFRREYQVATLTTFETKERSNSSKKEIESIRKQKKIGFNHHSGKLKIATIHSFKGYEAKTVFLILDENDSNEIVYTALTRSQYNLVVFTLRNSKYNDFFSKYLNYDTIGIF
ncbi:MAG: hypothetical protein KU38_11180 [Sulfurovum sp. FS08-3]|nr:MAG: hypothetical protein KU38_11180 [Sulfurovum sp. FS08-3]